MVLVVSLLVRLVDPELALKGANNNLVLRTLLVVVDVGNADGVVVEFLVFAYFYSRAFPDVRDLFLVLHVKDFQRERYVDQSLAVIRRGLTFSHIEANQIFAGVTELADVERGLL